MKVVPSQNTQNEKLKSDRQNFNDQNTIQVKHNS